MTIKEIAQVANVSESTVRNWIQIASAKTAEVSAKTAEARKTSKPADFTLPETIAIIKAGGNDTLASLLEENAKKEETIPKKLKVTNMTGALGRVYLDAATRGLISKDQFQQVMGLAKSGVYMTPEDSSRALEVIKRQYPVALPVQPHGSEKTRKAMYAAGRQTQEREEQKITQDRMNIHLDFDRGSQK